MGLVSPTQVTDGTGADASDINTPVNELANVINGNIEAANLASNAVSTAKIADDAVTDAKRPRMKAGVFTDPGDDATAASYAIIPLTVEEYNPESWTLASNRVTVGEAGLYQVFYQARDTTNANTEDIFVKLVKNGGGTPVDLGDVIQLPGATSSATFASAQWVGVLAASDTLELQAEDDGGASQEIGPRRLSIIKLSD